MGHTLPAYFEWLEQMAFFPGYALLYAIILIVMRHLCKGTHTHRLISFLPMAYALAGTLYLGLQMKNQYPNFSLNDLILNVHYPFLRIWALSSLLFWLPVLRRRTVFSLLHSLVFFFLMTRDIYSQLFCPIAGNDLLKNDLKIFSASFITNLAGFAAITLLYFLTIWFKRAENFHRGH
jgi:hypothetical protein